MRKRLLATALACLMIPTAALAQTPAAEHHEQATIAENVYDLLPAPTEKAVHVIASGEPDDIGRMGFVVRNDTDEPVAVEQTKVDVHDGAGKLIGVATSSTFVYPDVLAPGDLAAGWVYLNDINLTADATFTFTIATKAPDRMNDAYPNFAFSDVNNTGTALVGMVLNPGDVDVSFASFTAVCLSEDGTVTGFVSESMMPMQLAPGGETSFQVSLRDTDCEHFILGGNSM